MAQYIVIGYPSLGSEKDKRLNVCKNKKEVVGMVGIMLDHFNMKHIDIMRDDKHGDVESKKGEYDKNKMG